MRIKSLQMRAKVAVEGFVKGIHRSPYHGFSVEFSEYREYTPGDDTRYIDWKLFARSDRYHVKRFEDETNLRCYLVVDASRSMGYGSGEYTKGDYARTAAATIAYFLSPPARRRRPGHVRRPDHRLPPAAAPTGPPPPADGGMLEREPTGTATDLARPLEEIAATVRKRGLIVLISDLLVPLERCRTRLGYLRSRGHDVVVLRVLDPAEVDSRSANPAMFRDVESGREMYVDPAAARAEYLRRFAAHAGRIAGPARTWGSSSSRSPPTGRWRWCCSTCSRPGCGGADGPAVAPTPRRPGGAR